MPTPSRSKLPVILPWLLCVAVAVVWLYRENHLATQIKTLQVQVTAASANQAPDLRALAQDASLAARGKELYTANCATCHGTSGQGDGPASATINPKPRKYKTEPFKFGDDIASIYNTLIKGSPGTSMPSFALLPPQDLMALAHYVRTFVPNPTPTTEEILAKLPASASAGGGLLPVADTGPRIPIKLAMERLAQPAPAQPAAAAINSELPGAELYLNRCAMCHGHKGEGLPQRAIDVYPYRYQTTLSLAASQAGWKHNRNRFKEIVVRGLPGHSMPGNGTLTERQVDDLFQFVSALTAIQ